MIEQGSHWTDQHIKGSGDQWTAYDEAGLVYGEYKTRDAARDALVVYDATQLKRAPTMADAIAAGNGTLHGAIAYWQQRALKAEEAQPQEAESVDWSAFPAYLIDHYEGKIIYEETLQEALCAMLKDPKYHPPKLAAQQQGTPGTILWQPISSAPKDNNRPLYLANIRDGELRQLDFNGAWDSEVDDWEYGGQIYHYWAGEYGSVEEPTHWAYQDEPIPNVLPHTHEEESE